MFFQMAKMKKTPKKQFVAGLDATGHVRCPQQSHQGGQLNKWKEELMKAAIQEYSRQEQPGYKGQQLSQRELAKKWDVP